MKIKKERLVMAIIIGLIFLVLSVVIFVQFKTIQSTDINALETMQESELRTEISSIKAKYEETLSKLEETNSMIDEYRQTINSDKEASELLEKELEKSRNLLGKNEVTGSGVIVTLVDTETGENGKITAFDLIELVNELRTAGAEAISINDQRIIPNTYIVDLANTFISVNKVKLTSPYVVKAIGNITYLESGLSQKQYGYLDSKKNYGKNVSLAKSEKIKISAYNGELNFRYAKEVE